MTATSSPSLLSPLAPAGVAAAELFDAPDLPLHPDEAVHVEGAAEKRRRDFAAGRFCARAALAQLGLPDAVIPRGAQGAPVWPAGKVGSITHTKGYAAALAAGADRFLSVGLDAERAGDMTDALLPLLFGADERERLERLDSEQRRLAMTIMFSAKEAYYKAWNPVTGLPLSFQALHVALDENAFIASQPAATLPPWNTPIPGRYAIAGDLVVTALCVPRV